jgi:type 1 glutamine amidotransferase
MKKVVLMGGCVLVMASMLQAADAVIKVTPEWKAEIRKLAPSKPTVKPKAKRRLLVFNLMTGYKHWVTTNTTVMVEVLGDKSGAFDVVVSDDVHMFEADKLSEFDAVLLNNTCSKRDHRDLFLDALGEDKKDEVAALEKNLMEYVRGGKGLVLIHGGIVAFNNVPEIADMIGGRFDFHLPQQEMVLMPVDANHKLVKAFEGKPFVHVDEPYMFKGASAGKNFRPLLEVDVSKLKCGSRKQKVESDKRYAAWIKRYGKGRVFFSSPSHNARSFSQPQLLQFYLDGIQYALGDLECDDTPLKRK